MFRLIRNYLTFGCACIVLVYMLSYTSVNSIEQDTFQMVQEEALEAGNTNIAVDPTTKKKVKKKATLKFMNKQQDKTIFSEENFSHYKYTRLQLMLKETLVLGYFGTKARYKMFSNAFLAEDYFELSQEPSCVALQSTVDYAPQLLRYIQNWPGSISLAIFAPSYYFYYAVVYIKHLRKCSSAVKNQVTWHLAYPKLMPPPIEMVSLLKMELSCSFSTTEIFNALNEAFNTSSAPVPKHLLYPQNTMRNLARTHCKSQWVMCPDIDMVFPDPHPDVPSMYTRLNSFLTSKEAQECVKCAYVFPLYEVENLNNRVPETKMVLLEYIKNNTAQIYHEKVFDLNQGRSNLSAWQKLPLRDDVYVAAKINYTWLYEPVYIVKHGAPEFDERYIGYGMTRNTQALEMHLASYNFHLLDTVFLSHLWGLRVRKRIFNMRSFQVAYNTKIFFTFHARELALHYDTDLGGLLTEEKLTFGIRLNLGVHVNPTNEHEKLMEDYFKSAASFIARSPGTSGF